MVVPIGQPSSRVATLLGLIAILLWSTSIACSRRLTEQLGTYTAAAVVYLAAGTIGCGWLAIRRQLVPVLWQSDRRYLWGCGGLMACYSILLYTAVGMSPHREQIVAVTVANYLWPSLTLVFSVPLLHWSARLPQLAIGSLLALAGIGLALVPGGGTTATALAGHRHLLAIGCALTAAMAWGLFSNLSRRWGGHESYGAMPAFLLATGVMLLLLRLGAREVTVWTSRTLAEVGYMALFPTLVAYGFWDFAVRRGNLALIAAASYLTPVFSVWISSLYLGFAITPLQWLASALVVVGAVLCKMAIREETQMVET